MIKIIKKLKNTYSELSVQAKASLWFVFCSVLQRGIAFITVPIFTRIMTKEQYGYYNTYVSWYSILLVFTSMSLYYGVFNNAMIKFKEEKKRYVSSMQGLVCVLTVSFFIVYLLIIPYANAFLGMPTVLVLLLFAELLVTPALQFWSAYNRFEYKYRNIVTVTLIKSIANPILGIVLVIISENKGVARIVSAVVVEVIVCGSIAILQFFRGKCFYDKEFWKYAFVFNLPLIPHYLSGQILNQSDRIMISRLVDNSAVAMYSVAYSIGLLMNILTQAINGSYTPWFYQNVERQNYDGIRKITQATSLIMLIAVIILMLFAPEIMAIIGGNEYKEAVYVVPPVAASVFFIFMYNIFANIEFYFEKNKFVMIGSIVAALTNLVLNYIFIKIFGYIAAAYTTLFCYIVYCYMHQFFAGKVCDQNNIPRSIFNARWIAGLSVMVVSVSIGINLLYLNNLIRYVFILVLLIISIIKRNEILNMIKNILMTIRKKSIELK